MLGVEEGRKINVVMTVVVEHRMGVLRRCLLSCVITVECFAQSYASLCSRLRYLVFCSVLDKYVCWMWGWETEGKGRVCVWSVLCR